MAKDARTMDMRKGGAPGPKPQVKPLSTVAPTPNVPANTKKK